MSLKGSIGRPPIIARFGENTAAVMAAASAAIEAASFSTITPADGIVGLGDNTLENLTTAENVVAVGSQAGRDTTTGGNSVWVGRVAGRENQTGANNVGIGDRALSGATSPDASVAIGAGALIGGANGESNTAVGMDALAAFQGNDATAIGRGSLYQATGGSNTAVGAYSGGAVVAGGRNVLVGWNVGGGGSGQGAAIDDSIVIGYSVGADRNGQIVLGSSSSDEMKVFGIAFARWNPTSHNLFMCGAGNLSATGQYNTALGENAMANATTAHSSVAYGPFALESIVNGNQNVAVGGSTLRFAVSVGDSTVIGAQAGELVQTGVGMVAVGHRALGKCIAVNNQSAVGDSALWLNQGARNIAFGYVVAEYLQSGDDGVYLGTAAGRNRLDGDRNILIGAQAGAIGSATVNIATGDGAVAVGDRIVGIGYQSLLEATGSDHVAIGDQSGKSLTSGASCIFIGSSAGNHGSQKVDATGAIVIGTGAYATRDNEIIIGSSAHTHLTLNGVEFTKAQVAALLGVAKIPQWKVAATWTYGGSPVPYVDFIDLGDYQDIIVRVRGITLSGSDQRMVRCSVDNGATFYAANGDYTAIDAAGVENATGFSGFALHGTASASARSGTLSLFAKNLPEKAIRRDTRYDVHELLFTGSTAAINAVRVLGQSGSVNITGGSITVLGR